MLRLKYLVIPISISIILLLSGCQSAIRVTSNVQNAHIEIDNAYKFIDFTKTYNGDECVVNIRFRKGK